MPRSRKLLRYWDSDCFIGWLGAETDKQDKCRGVLQKAADGELQIVTSVLTLAEVLKVKGEVPVPKERREEIDGFFKQSWIILRDVTPRIATKARDLVWDSSINPKDAIHVATALHFKLPRLDTFDTGLHKKDASLGDPVLRIGRPDLPEQLKMNWFENS